MEEQNFSDFFKQKALLKLEDFSLRYHTIGCWVAIVANPIFVWSDFLNFPTYWKQSLLIRTGISIIVLLALYFRKVLRLNASLLIAIPLLLISLQNARMYAFASEKDLLGLSLNYMALFIGASLFILWRWYYSIAALGLSALATTWFVQQNATLNHSIFWVHGGMLLLGTGVFMTILIQARYNMQVQNLHGRIELEESKRQIENQALMIKAINASLEKKVEHRMEELQLKNKQLREYAFLNSHKLRAPVASILGVVQLFKFMPLDEEQEQLVTYLYLATKDLDDAIRGISDTLSKNNDLS